MQITGTAQLKVETHMRVSFVFETFVRGPKTYKITREFVASVQICLMSIALETFIACKITPCE